MIDMDKTVTITIVLGISLVILYTSMFIKMVFTQKS
jgi:hypothetical protein